TMGWVYRGVSDKIDEWMARKDEPGALFPLEKRKAFVRYPEQYRAFVEHDVDWAQIAVDECRKRGVRPWVHFRMNDLHDVDSDDGIFHDPFFFKAKENGWLNGREEYGRPRGTSGWVKNLYEFSHPEVTEWLLTYIEEMMLRYDVFGYGLDFIRNIYCIDYLHAEPGYQKYLTNFMRRVNEIRKKAEAKHGHEIKLMACLAHTVEANFIYGYDVKQWIEEGLIDLISPRCEEVCNSGVDVKGWRSAVGENFPLLIGYDDHISRWADAGAEYIYQVVPEHIKGYTAMYYNLGMDGVYFSNFYAPTQVKFGKDIDREMSNEGLRTVVITHEDIYPLGGYTPYAPLPINFGAVGGKAEMSLNIGTVKAGEHVYLTVGYDSKSGKDVSVTLAGHTPDSAAEIPVVFDKITGHYYDADYNLKKADSLIRYCFDSISGSDDLSAVFNSADADLNIVYVEISATPDTIE
ncbi:MAG: hypothetical protein IKV54_03965, partial [Clostridia bacterium]|nr:hypothetical protein [Clostridia bacterium]